MESSAQPSDEASFDALLETLDRKKGKDFEVLVKWFLQTDPEFAALYCKVLLWDEWHGEEKWHPRDNGVDLVAWDRDGRLYAIQAKHYSPQYDIKKKDIDSFLSESSRTVVHERLLVATTERIGPTARQVMAGQEKPVAHCLRDRMASALVSWPRSIRELNTGRAHPRLELRGHQDAAATDIVDTLAGVARTTAVMACGTGKTLVGIEVARRLNAELILVLAPSLALVDQNAQVWANNMEDIRATIKVCSDKRNKKEEDAGVAEAADLGPNVTTDPEIIAAFLRRSGRRVVFATYASSPQIAAAMRLCPEIRASIAVCDEAHHCAGVAGKSPRTILDEEDIRVEKRLFMTATPTIYAARDLTNLSRKRKIVLHSMDNEDDFGPVSHRLPFARAIELDLLCPYQVVVIPVYDTEIHQLIESNPYVTVDGGDTKILAYSLATQIACVRAMHAYKCQRMVSFHPKIAHSERFSDSFHLAVNLVSTEVSSDIAVCAEHIDGSGMPRAQRRDRLARFTDVTDPTRRLLSNVKVMAEGVDVPGIDAITMIDTMRNKAAMLQIVGRAIRKAPGKTIGTILLPVLVKKGQTPHEALRNSEHAAIYKLLAALKSTDPDLAQDIKDLWIRVDPVTGEPIDTGRFILSAAQEVGAEFADAINVMLADTLAPHRLPDVPLQGPSAVRNHANRKPTVEEPPRTTSTHEHGESEDTYLSSDLAWERAMNAIIPLGRRYQWASYDGDLLGTLPEIGRSWDPFPVRLWWQHVTHNWTDSFPTPSQKQQLSDTLSFLAADVESWPLIRAEMAALSARPLYMHIDAWLTTNGDTADQDLYWLAYFKQIGPSGLLKTQEVCDLLTHPTMPIEQRVGVVVKALLIAGDECQRRGNSVAFVEGFLDALVYRSSNDTENRSPLQSGGFPVSLYKAGWAVGDPFFPEAMHAQKMYAELPVSVRRRLAQKG